MLPEIFLPLVKYFTAFNIFQYITFRASYAAITALLISFVFGKPLIRTLRKMKAGQEVRSDGPETHLSKSGTPTMGGLLILVSVSVSMLLWQDLRNSYTWLLFLSMGAFGFIGFTDDYLKIFHKNSDGMHALVKFSGQTFVAAGIMVFLYITRTEHTTMLYLPFFKYPVLDMGLFYIPFGMLLLVGTSNAVNLTDGLDGLATGLVILVGGTFAILTYVSGRADYAEYLQIPFVEGSGELTIALLSLTGGSIGFLWYNSHPAEVFMGDTGSLALGGVIGVVALILKKEILLIIVGGVFVLEAVSVIVQVLSCKCRHRRVFKMAPLHHHFELKGWDESKVVIRFWILGVLFTILSLSTLKLQ